MRQPTFFENQTAPDEAAEERLTLFALGEFQARGKILAERELPLDRLRGALRRAAEHFHTEELSDERAVAALSALGAQVNRVPSYFAKHPFRVTAPAALAERALLFWVSGIFSILSIMLHSFVA
ncbi:MAG: hypothetical protein LC672_07100 [Acidobacteria bacterium]|nr:hypothetical protein [Acidobacteriota bacterium]